MNLDHGLILIADAIREKRGDTYALTDNGGEIYFKCPVFVMRSYCWCDGDNQGHEAGCPPNFEHYRTGLRVEWYKYVGRGMACNMATTAGQWADIVAECIAAVKEWKP